VHRVIEPGEFVLDGRDVPTLALLRLPLLNKTLRKEWFRRGLTSHLPLAQHIIVVRVDLLGRLVLPLHHHVKDIVRSQRFWRTVVIWTREKTIREARL
jgi:hypothetical protein